MKTKLTVAEAHPELLHYTSLSGLLGILDSQSLRATHSAFLNDSTEIALFFDRRLANLLDSSIRAELAADPELRVLPQFSRTPQESDAVIARYASDMARAIRTTAQHLNQPHFVCFSAPFGERVRHDGLLSQWRGYGKDGGYAIVFDSTRLEELLASEAKTFWYEHVQWGDVHYHQDDGDLANAEPEIIEAEEALGRAIRAFIKNPVSEELEPTFDPIATLSCLYKDWGFHEEREVRIVVIPPNADLIAQGRALGEARPIRQIEIIARGGTPVPYIDLFAPKHSADQGPRIPLPISRIIVGPNPQSELRRQAVKQLLRTKGIHAEVTISRIPFVGS